MKKKLEGAVSAIVGFSEIQDKYGLSDHIELQIFHRIGVCAVRQNPLTVGDVLRWDDIASSATLHKRISDLRAKDLINVLRETDLRCKVLTLTDKGERYLLDAWQAFTAVCQKAA